MPEPLSSTISIVSQGLDLLDKTGILGRVKNKLLDNPDVAAAKLALVLTELSRTYQIVDDTIVSFASLTFDDADAVSESLGVLYKARGGGLETAMMDARAHCHKIWYIYDRYLRGWFSRALRNRQDEDELFELFSRLSGADGSWVDMLASVARDMQQTSDDMLTRLDSGDIAGARALQRDVLKEFRTLQTRLGKGLVDIQQLKQDFSALTGGMDI